MNGHKWPTDDSARDAGVLAACEAQGCRAEPIRTTAGMGDPDLRSCLGEGWGSRALARLALVLAAGGLPLDTPGALLVGAVADGTFIDLNLSAGRDHRCVRVAVWPCAQMGEVASNWEKACWDLPTQLQALVLSGSNCHASSWNYVNWPHVSFMMFSS